MAAVLVGADFAATCPEGTCPEAKAGWQFRHD